MSQADKPRSQFVLKLHELLSAEQHPDWLKWLSNDTFGITSIESQAKAALAPQWEFRSLSSFIRQLSYYSFKRLSDRRRSAERRAHCPSLIVFTHTSGNFVRDDPSKTANIPRKLRARKSTAGSRRKSSTASSLAFDYEYQDRSPTPDVYYQSQYDDEPPTQTQLSLASYQLPPWTLPTDAQTSPRSLPLSPQAVAPVAPSLRDGVSSYECAPDESPLSRSYPSPVSAGSAFSYSANASCVPSQPPYRDPTPQQPAPSTYYYSQPAYSQASYPPNELPPIRTITSGLVAPLSPPPEAYSHYSQVTAPQPLRRSSHVYDTADETSSLSSSTVATPGAIPNGLAGHQQIDQRVYYPPSPPRQHVQPVHVPHYSHHPPPSHEYYAAPAYSCGADVTDEPHKPFYHFAGREALPYTMSTYH